MEVVGPGSSEPALPVPSVASPLSKSGHVTLPDTWSPGTPIHVPFLGKEGWWLEIAAPSGSSPGSRIQFNYPPSDSAHVAIRKFYSRSVPEGPSRGDNGVLGVWDCAACGGGNPPHYLTCQWSVFKVDASKQLYWGDTVCAGSPVGGSRNGIFGSMEVEATPMGVIARSGRWVCRCGTCNPALSNADGQAVDCPVCGSVQSEGKLSGHPALWSAEVRAQRGSGSTYVPPPPHAGVGAVDPGRIYSEVVPPLPAGWVRRDQSDGRAYFEHASSQVWSWEHPSSLAPPHGPLEGGFGADSVFQLGRPQRRRGLEAMWQCSSCGNVNFGDKVVCNRRDCQKPLEDEVMQPGWKCRKDVRGSRCGGFNVASSSVR